MPNTALQEQTAQNPGFLGSLLGGISSTLENATLYGSLLLNQRILDQFPEQAAPNNEEHVPTETALAESGIFGSSVSTRTALTVAGLSVGGILVAVLLAKAFK